MKARAKLEVHEHVLDELDHAGLRPGKLYDVIGIDHYNFRIIDEAGEPILYPRYLFDVEDSTIPDWWIRTDSEDGGYYIDPPELSTPGFYEDYFDHKEEAIQTFQQYLQKMRAGTLP